MRSWRWYSKLLCALVLAAFAYFVWPTPWHYHHHGTTLLRINRLTGTIERPGRPVDNEHGWQRW